MFRLKKSRIAIGILLAVMMVLLVASVQARQYVTIERENMTTAGAQGGAAQRPSISGDGRYVTFWTNHSFVPEDTGVGDIYVRDRQNIQTRRVSVGFGNTQPNAETYAENDISASGNQIVFASTASNLIAAGQDTNNKSDVFLYDLGNSQMARVSIGNGGLQGNEDSFLPVISGNGQLIAFRSKSNNWVAGDPPPELNPDIYIFDRGVGQIALVNVSSGGVKSACENELGGIAINFSGVHVAFESCGNNLVAGDTNGTPDIFVRNRLTNTTVRVTVASDGTQANSASSNPSINSNTNSALDGRYVAFYSAASNLVSGDSNGKNDVFLHDRDTDGDGVFDEAGAISTTLISVATDGTQGNNNSYNPILSDDGRYVAFWSEANNLVPGDTNGVGDIFMHDVATGVTTRVSVGRNGEQANGGSSFFLNLSGDSRFVAFESSASNLVENDTNGVGDVFVAAAGPNPPTNLVAEPLTTSSIGLTWEDNADNETKYTVERSANGGQTWFEIAGNLPANTESYTDSSLATCIQYSYRVFAVNNITKSSSNIATASTLGCPPGQFILLTPPDDYFIINPAGLAAFTWSESSEADTYNFKLRRTVGEIEEIADITSNAADICDDDECAQPIDSVIQAELVDGEYEWEVSATNDLGTTQATNNPFTFEVDTTLPPRAFDLLTPVNNALIRDVTTLTAITWDYNPDAFTYGLLLLKASNNPISRDLGVVVDMVGLTPVEDGDLLTCTTTVCSYTIDDTLEAELTVGTYIWTARAFSPAGTESEATNAPFLFSINTGDIELVLNGGFEEDAEADKIPDYWSPKLLTSDKVKCNKDKNGDGIVDKIFAHTGNCAFEFKGSAGESSKIQQKPDVAGLALATGDALTLSGYVAGKSVVGSAATIQVKIKYVSTSLPKDKLTLTAPAGTYEYDDLSGNVGVDNAVDNIKVIVGHKGVSGKVRFDDVSLILIGTGSTRSGLTSSDNNGNGLIPLPDVPNSENNLSNRQ